MRDSKSAGLWIIRKTRQSNERPQKWRALIPKKKQDSQMRDSKSGGLWIVRNKTQLD